MDNERKNLLLSKVYQCVRPMMWENDDDTYSYSTAPTGFFVTTKEILFFITTLHGVANGDFKDIFVTPSPISSTGVIFDSIQIAKIADVDPEDNDHADYLLAKVNLDRMSKEELNLLNPFPIISLSESEVLFDSGKEYVFCGFPFEKSNICYEQKEVRRRMEGGYAYYVEPFVQHCHTLRFGGVETVDDMNGFSGSPVFAVSENNDMALAGMVLRSTKNSGLMHVLDWKFLYAQIVPA